MTTNIKDYSTTQASNISLNGIDTNEGMLPSSLNNAIRALMKNTRDWYNESQWIGFGDGSGTATVTFASSTSFTIAGADVTSIYHVGRRVKIIATTPGTIFGTITAVTFSTNTTVTVVFDSGSLSNEPIDVYIGALTKTNSSIPAEIITTSSLADGSVTAVKLAVNSVTTDKILNANVTLAKLASDSVDGSKIADNSINSEHYVDGSIDTQHIADSQITLAKMASNSVNSANIVDDSIVNADINSSAAISLSKLENLTTARALVSDGNGDVSVSAVTSTEIGHLDGVTSAIQTQIDSKQPTITGSASTIDTESLTADRAVISNSSQKIAVSDVTSTELSYLDGVTSAVQTQIDSKQATITGAATTIDTENLTASRALTSNGSGKVEVSDVTSTELGFLDGVSSSIQTQLDGLQTSNANLTAIGNLARTDGNLIVGNGSTWVAENGATARTSLGLGSVATQAANNVSISGGSVTGLGEPSNNTDAATKSYVDQSVAGLRTRLIAEAATTANINLSNALEAGDAIDGVTLVAGDRVLVKDQSTATENGLYIAVANGAGAASRDPEHDTIAELSGGMIVVNQGSTNDNKIFLCTTDSNGSIGSTAITYTQVTPSNSGTVTSIATGTGIDGGTITSTGTISIDSTVATLSGTQTLTNKTLTSPKINEDVAVTSTATELNKLDALSRGSLIYGNSSAATAILTKGGAGTILTSDGTDISWQSTVAAAITSTANGADNRIATYTGATGLNGEANLTFDGSTLVTAGLSISSDPILSATGANSNIDLDLLAKGTGHVTIRGNDNPGTIQFNCENNSHGQQIKGAAHSLSSSAVVTIPDVTGDMIVGKVGGTNFSNSLLIGHSTTQTLNNASENTGVGIQALDNLTSGDANTALGQEALSATDTGLQNTAVGKESMRANTSGSKNTSIGSESLETNSNGNFNSALGRRALFANSSGSYNTGIGTEALNSVTGSRNIGLGASAGQNITSGSGNVIIGEVDAAAVDSTRTLKIAGYDGSTTTTWISGDSSGNLTFPAEVSAVSLDISGDVDVDGTLETDALSIASTAVTSTAAELNILDGVTSTATELNILDGVTSTTAELNILDGVTSTAAELNLLDGKDATFLAVPGKLEGTNFTNSLLIGHATTGTLNDANRDVGVGIGSLDAITVADDNTAVGYNSGSAITSGGSNTIIGNESNLSGNPHGSASLGYQALKVNAGNNNIGIGRQAGKNITSGSGNVIVGGVDAPSATGDRQLKISGYDGTNTTNWISGDSSGNLTTPAKITFTTGGVTGEAIPGLMGPASGNDSRTVQIGHANAGSSYPYNNSGRNVIVGFGANYYRTSGADNVILGYNAMLSGQGGQQNVGIGSSALKDNVSGANVAAVGYNALSNSTGSYNTGFGAYAGVNITSGVGNVMLGHVEADSATGDRQLKIAGYDGTTRTTWISGDSNGQVKLTAGYIAEVALTDASTITWNAATQPVAKVTLTANRTMGLPANPLAGQFISLLVIQDGTGSRTITWNAAYEFAADTAPTLTATANLGDLFTFRYNGAKWLEVGRNLALTLS